MNLSASQADEDAVRKISSTIPVLKDLAVARNALDLKEGELGHAGPPFAKGEIIPPVVLNALAGAVVHEEWAGDLMTAKRMVVDGQIRLRSNHSLGTVSPMAGVVRPSQVVLRVVDASTGATTYATLAEKGRRVLRFGFYDEEVAAGLNYVETVVAEAITAALPPGGLPLLPIVAQGVSLGDDVHQRNVGGALAFLAALPDLAFSVRTWLSDHPQHFLNYAMAAAKLSLDQARDTPRSGIVTAISRNGNRCGIQIAGAGDRWFNADADLPDGRFFEPYSRSDAHRDLGDSAIMESFGLGGCIAHCSPDIAAAMGQSWPNAQSSGRQMRQLFSIESPVFQSPWAGAEGIGLGLDARKVAAGLQGVRIHTGISHRDGEAGWIGIGVARAPLQCFTAAAAYLMAAEN
jgi:hypothetical protein